MLCFCVCQLCDLARNCGLVERLLPEHQVFSGSRHGGSGRLRVRVSVAYLCGLLVARRPRGSLAAVLRANSQRRRTEDSFANLDIQQRPDVSCASAAQVARSRSRVPCEFLALACFYSCLCQHQHQLQQRRRASTSSATTTTLSIDPQLHS